MFLHLWIRHLQMEHPVSVCIYCNLMIHHSSKIEHMLSHPDRCLFCEYAGIFFDGRMLAAITCFIILVLRTSAQLLLMYLLLAFANIPFIFCNSSKK
jgi:hypothetical protein